MKKNIYLVLGVGLIVLLWLFSRRKIVASNAPVAQGGLAAGGVNFVSVDEVTGLPVFDSTANPVYIKGLAPDVGGTYTCANGTVPAVNAANGSVYCVIPAESGIYTPTAPVVAAASIQNFVPQGPTQDGGYIGQAAFTPQGPAAVQTGVDANGNPVYSAPPPPPDPIAAAGGTDGTDFLLWSPDAAAGSVFSV